MFPGLQSLFQFIPKVVDWGQSLCRPKSKTHLCMGLSLLQVFFSSFNRTAFCVHSCVSYYGLKRLCVFMLDDIHEIHLAHTKSVCNCIYVPSALYEYLAWLNKISSQTIKTLKVCSLSRFPSAVDVQNCTAHKYRPWDFQPTSSIFNFRISSHIQRATGKTMHGQTKVNCLLAHLYSEISVTSHTADSLGDI